MTRTSRRSLLKAVAAAWAAGSRREAWATAAAALESPLAGNELAQELLQMSDAQLAKLEEARQKGLLELAPVNLPTPDRYTGDNDHFGWPVATTIDDTLIVSHRRNLGHKKGAEQEQDETSSYSVVVRSQDGGKTWSEPYDLRDCMKPDDRNRGGFTPLSHRYKFNPKQDSFLGYKLHLIAMGTTKDGGVVIISDHGAFRSDDKGKTWRHFSKAFRDDTMEGPILYTAPRLFEHPEYGLVLLAHSMPNRYLDGGKPPPRPCPDFPPDKRKPDARLVRVLHEATVEHLPHTVFEDRHRRPISVPHLRAHFPRPGTQLEWPHHAAGKHRPGQRQAAKPRASARRGRVVLLHVVGFCRSAPA